MASTYDAISTYTVSGGATTTITFDSIPQTYTDLVLIFRNVIGGNYGANFRYNNDSASNYESIYHFGQNSSVFTNQSAATTHGGIASGLHEYAESWINIQNYTATNMYKTHFARMTGAGDDSNPWSTRDVRSWLQVGQWRSTSAITRIDFYATGFTAGSTLTLYGIKAA